MLETEEYETNGTRALLNFGQTLGQAIEAAAGYGRLLHGASISLGLRAAAWLSAQISDLTSVQESDIPESSQFLLEIDFKGLILSRLDRQSYWVAAMQAAIKAGRRMSTGTWKRTGRTQGTEATRGT